VLTSPHRPACLQEELVEEKQNVQGRAVYCLGPDTTRGGFFFLGNILNATPRREYFLITPNGYYFRKKVGEVAGGRGGVLLGWLVGRSVSTGSGWIG